ncbi:Caldesmon [Entamoeba marina]
MTTQSIKIAKPFFQILLQNEPILTTIESRINVPPGSLKLMKKQFIICESNPEKLKEVGTHLKTEFKKYCSFTTKVQLTPDTNIQLVMTHYLNVQWRFPSTSDLRFAVLSEQKTTTEFIIYGKKEHSITLMKPMINKDAINIFETYPDLLDMPSIVKRNYHEIINLVDKYNLTTIPKEFEPRQPPIVYGFRTFLKEFKKRIEQLEAQIFTTIKHFFDERFHVMLAAALKNPPDYRCVFTLEKKSYSCDVHVEKEFATNDDITRYTQYVKEKPAPFNTTVSCIRDKKTGNKQLVACVATNKDINILIPTNWESELKQYIKNADNPIDDTPLPPLPPKGRKKPLPQTPDQNNMPPVPPINPNRQSTTKDKIPTSPRRATNADVIMQKVKPKKDRSLSVCDAEDEQEGYYDQPYEGDENYEDVYYGDSYYGDDGYYYIYNYDTKRYYVSEPPAEDLADVNEANVIDDTNKQNKGIPDEQGPTLEMIENAKIQAEKIETERLEQEKTEQERLEKEKAEQEKERLEQEKAEQERLEQERLEQERLEQERLEQEKLEQEKLEQEKLEQERLEQERLEQERLEKEKAEQEKLEQEKAEQERLEKEKLEKERLEKEKAEKEKLEQEKLEQEKAEQERLEQEKAEQEKAEQEKLEQEKIEQEKLEQEKLEQEKAEQERLEQEKLEQEKIEQEKIEQEKLEKEKAEKEKLEQEEKAKKEKLEQEKVEQEIQEVEVSPSDEINEEDKQENDDDEDFSVATFDDAVVVEPAKHSIDDLCAEAQESNPPTVRRPARGGKRKPPSKKLIENQKKMRVETNAKDEKQNTFKLPQQTPSSGDSTAPKKNYGGMGMGMPMVTMADLQKKKQPAPSLSGRRQAMPVKQESSKDEKKDEKKGGLFGKKKGDKKADKKDSKQDDKKKTPLSKQSTLPTSSKQPTTTQQTSATLPFPVKLKSAGQQKPQQKPPAEEEGETELQRILRQRKAK